MEKHSECVTISQLPHDIIRTNCPIFDSYLFFIVTVSHCVSEVEMIINKEHEDESEKLSTLNQVLVSLQRLLSYTRLVNSNCSYLCQDSMNNIKLYF